jgi:hypothetical protein
VTNHVTSQATSYATKDVTQRDSDYVTSSVANKVQPDDGSWMRSTYRDFRDIFSKKKAETLPPHRPTDHAIDREPGTKLPYGRIYSLLEVELKALKAKTLTKQDIRGAYNLSRIKDAMSLRRPSESDMANSNIARAD